MPSFIVKAMDKCAKGDILDKLWLDRVSVEKAIKGGLDLTKGTRVTVKVKVGKRRKLIKAYITRETEVCCNLHHGQFIGYIAER